jgi:hypothetical protein
VETPSPGCVSGRSRDPAGAPRGGNQPRKPGEPGQCHVTRRGIAAEDAMDHEGPQQKITQIDEALVKRELGQVVRETVEETLNKLLDAEAGQRCKAGKVRL